MQATVYAGRRLELYAPAFELTAADYQEAAATCTTFLDRCAAEAAAAGWFPGRTRPLTSTLREQVCEVLAECPHGATNEEIRVLVGYAQSSTEKALRELLADGRIRIASKRKWARVYEVADVR